MTTIPTPVQRGALRYATDCAVLTGRGLRLSLRQPDALIMGISLPVVMMLLFVYVFGGAMDVGGAYRDYVIPGVIVLASSFGASWAAPAITEDLTTGTIDRMRSLPMAPSALLVGHVAESVVRNLVAGALVLGVAVAMGFRPTASPLAWLAIVGLVVAFLVAVSWVSVGLGALVSSREAASGATFGFLFLPYISSGFVPTETLPGILHGFAEHQPLTPIIEAMRALLLGQPVGDAAWMALAWCLAITAVAWPLAVLALRRRARLGPSS